MVCKPVTEEVKDVRDALKKEGYEIVYCRHGKGTAYNWIEVQVVYPDNAPPMTTEIELYPGNIEHRYTRAYEDYYHKLHWLVQQSAGRGDLADDIQTDYFCVNILVEVVSRERYLKDMEWKKKQADDLKKSKTCKVCGTLGVYQKRRIRYTLVYKCPKCGKEWAA